jgi:hypothetical protein
MQTALSRIVQQNKPRSYRVAGKMAKKQNEETLKPNGKKIVVLLKF